MRRPFLFCLSLFCQLAFSQGFKVKSLTTNLSDLSASIHPREDGQGHPCGLVKVQTKVQGVEFGDDVVGNVENKSNEYWVYLPKGARELLIMRPNYLPMTVTFQDYDIEAVTAKTTYILTLKEDNLNPEKCGVTFHIKPYESVVQIDGIPLKVNNDGNYRVNLPKGDHVCMVSAEGYKPKTEMIKTGKGAQEMQVELESDLADVSITCQTSAAEIFIDSISKGIGGWSGKLMPGPHRIEVKKEGCKPASQVIQLSQKEQRTINIPHLQPLMGKLNISTTPDGCHVFIDGEEYERTPCTIKDIPYGAHQLVIQLDSCGFKKMNEMAVIIKNEREQSIECELLDDSIFKLHSIALEWFKKGYPLEAINEYEGYNPTKAAKVWYDKIIDILDDLEVTFLLHKVWFPDFMDAFHDRSYPTIGIRLAKYYSGHDYLTEDDCTFEPKKVERILQKLNSKESTSQICLYIAMGYGVHNNTEMAFVWWQKWIDNWSHNILNMDNWYNSSGFFVAGKAITDIVQQKDWYKNSIRIIKKRKENDPSQASFYDKLITDLESLRME